MNIRIYIEGNSFVIESNNNKSYYSRSANFQEVIDNSGKISILMAAKGNSILPPTLFSNIKDKVGVSLGATLNDTLTELSSILNQGDLPPIFIDFFENQFVTYSLYENISSGTIQGSIATQTGIQIIRDSYQGADVLVSEVGGDGYPQGNSIIDSLGNIVIGQFDPIDTPPDWELENLDTNGEDYALLFRVRGTREDLTTYLNDNPQYSFIDDIGVRPESLYNEYLINYEPSTEVPITGGTVIQYNSDTEIIYRFIPDPYVYDSDAFYRNFDGTNLSVLIVTRK